MASERLRTRLAGLLCAALAATAGAAAPAPSVTFAAEGSVEVAFTPYNDPEAALLGAIRAARTQILVQAYAFTSRALARALLEAHERGVQVEVLLDAEMNRPASFSVLPLLLAGGIEVAVETRYASAHNKVMIFDAGSRHGAVATGSYNYTRSARLANAENLLILRGNPALVTTYLENWQRHRAEARVLRSLDDLPPQKRKEDGRESDRPAAD